MGAQQKHRPEQSGYHETRPTELPRSAHDHPDPDAAGNQRAQVAAATHKTPGEPGESEPGPEPDEPTPPGEHKREPIHDPDPADTKMHVQQSSR